jgi:hypothetical protein
MPQTESERVFEQFCTAAGIPFSRILEEATPTPDYTIRLGGQDVVVEVKEIDPTPEEQESERLIAERGHGLVIGGTPGEHVRKKIAKSSAQIKARTHGKLPSILVLFNGGRASRHVESYQIRVAMYGLEQVNMAVPNDPSIRPYSTGMSYGPKRKMTENDNTSISGIGVLFMTGPEQTRLHVYHNTFAAVPLESGLLAGFGIPQFALEDETPGRTAQWMEIG